VTTLPWVAKTHDVSGEARDERGRWTVGEGQGKTAIWEYDEDKDKRADQAIEHWANGSGSKHIGEVTLEDLQSGSAPEVAAYLYGRTQAGLADAGVKSRDLWRGMTVDRGKLLAAIESGTMNFPKAAAWSQNDWVGEEFIRQNLRRGTVGVILSLPDAPADRIIASHDTSDIFDRVKEEEGFEPEGENVAAVGRVRITRILLDGDEVGEDDMEDFLADLKAGKIDDNIITLELETADPPAGGSKEKEFLLPRGTQYRILGVEERDGVHYARAEQVTNAKAAKSLRDPWRTKSARFDPSKHRRAADGKFGSGGGGAAPKDDPRPNADLDAVWNDDAKPAAPKPAGDPRANPDLDAFMGMGDEPKPAKPQPGPARPGAAPPGRPQQGVPDAASGKAASDAAQAHMKMAQAARKAGDDATAAKFLHAAYSHHMAAVHHSTGNHAEAEKAKHAAAGHLEGVGGPPAGAAPAKPAAMAAAGPAGRRAFPGLQLRPRPNPAASGAKPAAPGAAPSSGPPALPHHRTHQTALGAANAVVAASKAGGDVRAAHKQAMDALDAHLTAGIAELDRRGGDAAAKKRFTAKIAAARAKLNGIAGVDGDHRSEPRESVRRPAVRPAPKDRWRRKGFDLAVPTVDPWVVTKSLET
jgi:hypothetical protein